MHRIPEWLVEAYVARAGDLLIQSVTSPSSLWFDGNVQRARDELLTASLAKAASATDKAKTVTFAHPLAVTEASASTLQRRPVPAARLLRYGARNGRRQRFASHRAFAAAW